MLMHHHPGYLDAIEADRRRLPVYPDDLERLVRAAAGGDPAAWSTLFERFAARMRRVARRHRLQQHDADDVLQTTWLRLVEHIGKLREPPAIGAWLETTARNESLRVLAAANRVLPTDDDMLDVATPADAPEDVVVTAERRQAIADAIAALPPAQRELFALLVDDRALSYAEIAAALAIPIGSIGPTRARGIERLRHDPRLAVALGEP